MPVRTTISRVALSVQTLHEPATLHGLICAPEAPPDIPSSFPVGFIEAARPNDGTLPARPRIAVCRLGRQVLAARVHGAQAPTLRVLRDAGLGEPGDPAPVPLALQQASCSWEETCRLKDKRKAGQATRRATPAARPARALLGRFGLRSTRPSSASMESRWVRLTPATAP